MTRGRHAGVAPLAAALAVLIAGCSTTTTQGSAPVPVEATAATACHRPQPPRPVVAAPVGGVPGDWNITSFDGTPIRAHWFPVGLGPGQVAPTVLMGPGWSLSGDTDTQGTGIVGGVAIKDLRAAGYNVLTWDPRGFGRSGGKAEVDSPAYEGRDVSTLIDWVATLPGVRLDRTGDPRMGMVGGSYGGGIQLVTAAIDCRVDAIVPTIAWHSLTTSLDKAGTPKTGWGDILSNLTTASNVDPEVLQTRANEDRTGTITASEHTWFADRGPASLVGHVDIPTLIVQGTVDTLFTLQEGVTNYQILKAHGIPTAMVWFCGGHGVCLTPPGNQQLPEAATIAWLDRYVKGDTSIHTGPGFVFVDQNGTTYSAAGYPMPAGPPVTATGSGVLALVGTGGSGPVDTAGSSQLLAPLVGSITPASATHAVDVDVSFADGAAVVVGAPLLRLTYHGTSPAGGRPTRVFAQLVDGSTGRVLGNQITPVDVTLDGATHTTSVPLEIVAFTGMPHAHLVLQLVATTVAYAQPRLGGSVDFTRITVSLPVASTITPRS